MTHKDEQAAAIQAVGIADMHSCLKRLSQRLTYLEGSIVLIANGATYIAWFSMDKSARQETFYVRPDGDEKRHPLSRTAFYSQMNTVTESTLLTAQDRIHPDLLSRRPKPQTLKFADDAAYWEAERQRLSDLTLEHTVPILRFDLQWEPQGERSRFAAALFTDSKKQVHFELANR